MSDTRADRCIGVVLAGLAMAVLAAAFSIGQCGCESDPIPQEECLQTVPGEEGGPKYGSGYGHPPCDYGDAMEAE